MKLTISRSLLFRGLPIFLLITGSWRLAEAQSPASVDKRYLYVATPGIRNYLGYGGHGILVFDMDNNHRLVKRIKTGGILSDSLMGRMKQGGYASAKGDDVPSNVKGIAVSIPMNSVYV